MRVLVTGGAGFIGSNFVHYWTQKYPHDEVIVLDKLTYAGHIQNIQELIDNHKVEFLKGDICDPRAVNEAMYRTDIVVHFAAESHVDRSIVSPIDFINTNVLGTFTLLQEARKSNLKLFHHVSTDEVFGSLGLDQKGIRFSERTPYNPHSPYSASKASSDHLVRAFHTTYGVPTTITNTSNNIGPYQDTEKLFPRFITNLSDGEQVPLMGEGENVRDWIYVEDHCRAIDFVIRGALKNPRLIGETFCVGGNAEKTNKEVTLAILKLMGKDESFIKRIDHRLGHDERYAIDSTKIRYTLGWTPEFTFEEGLKKTIDWYMEHQDWWRPLKEGKPNVDPEVQRKRIERI